MRRFLLTFLFLLFSASAWAQTTYYVDVTTGNDGDDGLTEGNAWQTIQKATTETVAGDTVYIKGSASYTAEDTTSGGKNSVWNLKTAGGITTPILWEGYSSTPGDNGIVTIDASGETLANAMNSSIGGGNIYHTFKNFRFTGGSSQGVNLSLEDRVLFVFCRFDTNADDGIEADNFVLFVHCTVDNNAGRGIDTDETGGILFCKIYNNGSYGSAAITCTYFASVFYDNTTSHINGASSTHVYNCTFDGNNSTVNGIINFTYNNSIANSIFSDCATAISGLAGTENLVVSLNNLYDSNTVNVTNFPLGDNAVEADPLFDASLPYRLQNSSPAIAAGVDAGALTTSTLSFLHIGAIAPEPAAGGGVPIRARRHGL